MSYSAMAIMVAALLWGQNQDPLVDESDLAPPGESQVTPPRAPVQQPPAVQPPAPQPAPPAIEQAPTPPATTPEPAEAEGIRRTFERPGGGRPVAAFWFID